MKNSAELEAIREKLRVEMGYSMAVGADDVKIAIVTSDGAAPVVREMIKAFMTEIEKRQLAHVKVTIAGRTEKVDGQPVVEVTVPGKKVAVYKDATAQTAREIIASIDRK